MAELEIHHESEHKIDPEGQRVGVLAAILAVLLAVVTIASHRTHTAGIIEKSAANDQWQHYQSSRLKFHNLELGESLVKQLAPKGEASDAAVADYEKQKKKYEEQAREIQEQARQADERAEAAERRALRYDFGEGLLEIGLVLSSLYFISRKKMFPVIGIIAAAAGVALALAGLAVH
jgi:uncharacterized protein DUF4337